MVKRKVDPRIRTLIESSVEHGHRGLFVLIGDNGKDQVVHLHYMLSKAQIAARPSVLWCYKKELGFSSNKKKRMKTIMKKREKGVSLNDVASEDNMFDRFLATTEIRYCYYKESERILGNTYGMCVLQDFEALTPNLLARTIETVQGGGIIVLLLNTLSSLQQLYTMSMDVHSRYRTESGQNEDIVSRFNERFLLSLAGCNACLFIDDELNVLAISSFSREMISNGYEAKNKEIHDTDIELKTLKEERMEKNPIEGKLISLAKTIDQANVISDFIAVVADKTLRNTVSLTAARGRGKSAAMGLAIASAVVYGYSSIFVTSPHPDNLKTLFSFIFKGLDAVGYEEHVDYDIIQSTNPDMNQSVIRVNIFKTHRQTIQYIEPKDSGILGQAELVVVDEAAAIPLPIVRSLMGPYLTFMASTINGYEGTGRSLSLKLIQQLREQSAGRSINMNLTASRGLKELKLERPIRYRSNDPIEGWLNRLLCFEAATTQKKTARGCPHPSSCELYYVNRDTLFSFHDASEDFLQKMMSLYVSSHYKNTPNDLQLMSDAPAHHLFVLLPPIDEDTVSVPDILVVIQVCIEGEISRKSILKAFSRGQRGGGDLIPWTLSQQFQDNDFPSLSGARIVRIATHPEYQKMGYGSRAMHLLEEFYLGKMMNLDEIEESETFMASLQMGCVDANGFEKIEPKKNLPPLLLKLSERRPEELQWLGVSFGVTQSLIKFWKKLLFAPVYLRQTKNELTGEHTVIMLKTLNRVGDDVQWLDLFYKDFYRRFLNLLPMSFSDMPVSVVLEVLSPPQDSDIDRPQSLEQMTHGELMDSFSAFDLKRLESYVENMVDFHVILDLLPIICNHYFMGKLKMRSCDVLSPAQTAILISIGCQMKSIDDLETILNLPSSQLLAMFAKILKRFSGYYKEIRVGNAVKGLEPAVVSDEDTKNSGKKGLEDSAEWDPTSQTLDDELQKVGTRAERAFREKQRELIDSLDLNQYAIKADDESWREAMKTANPGGLSIKKSGTPSKSSLLRTLQIRQETEKNRKIEKGLGLKKHG